MFLYVFIRRSLHYNISHQWSCNRVIFKLLTNDLPLTDILPKTNIEPETCECYWPLISFWKCNSLAHALLKQAFLRNPRAANEQKWAWIMQQNLWTICLQPIGHKQRKPCLTNQDLDRGINWCRMLFSFAKRFLEVLLVQQTSAEIFKHSSNIELIDLVFYPLMWFSDVVIFSCTTQWLATSRRDLGSSNHLSFGEERMNQQSLFVYKELWDTAGVWTQYCTYGIYCITEYNVVWCLYQTTQALKSQHRSCYQVCDEYNMYIYISIYLSLSQRFQK